MKNINRQLRWGRFIPRSGYYVLTTGRMTISYQFPFSDMFLISPLRRHTKQQQGLQNRIVRHICNGEPVR